MSTPGNVVAYPPFVRVYVKNCFHETGGNVCEAGTSTLPQASRRGTFFNSTNFSSIMCPHATKSLSRLNGVPPPPRIHPYLVLIPCGVTRSLWIKFLDVLSRLPWLNTLLHAGPGRITNCEVELQTLLIQYFTAKPP